MQLSGTKGHLDRASTEDSVEIERYPVILSMIYSRWNNVWRGQRLCLILNGFHLYTCILLSDNFWFVYSQGRNMSTL